MGGIAPISKLYTNILLIQKNEYNEITLLIILYDYENNRQCYYYYT